MSMRRLRHLVVPAHLSRMSLRLLALVAALAVVQSLAPSAARAASAPATQIYWTDANWWNTASAEVGRATIDGAGVDVVEPVGDASPGVQQTGYIALDPAQGHVYWAENFPTFSIRRAHVDGTGSETVITPGGWPFGVAVSADHVYWTDTVDMSIKRARLDGTASTTLVTGLGISGSHIASPHDLALDLPRGKMYWTATGLNAIQRADLDGSHVETIVSTPAPMGIGLDLVAGKVYWAAGDGIFRADLAGGHTERVLRAGPGQPVDVAVDPVGGKLYWTEEDSETRSGLIRRAGLDGRGQETLVSAGLSYPWGLALASVATYPEDLPGAPSSSQPFVTLRPGIVERVNGAGVDTVWPGDGGIARYVAESSVDGAPFIPFAVKPGRTSYVLLDRSYRLRVRVVDATGSASPWATGPRFSVSAASPVLFDGRWTRVADRAAIDGSTRYTTTAGARGRLRFYGSSVAWVSSTGANRGRATVWVDGQRAGKVDLSGPATVRRSVFTRSWPSSGWHTIAVVAEGTAGRPRVDVDAFLVVNTQAPTRSSWTQSGPLPTGATFSIVHRLPDGSVLVAGAWASMAYRTGTGFWGSVVPWGEWSLTGPMVHQRATAASVLLRDGRVLAAGGSCCGPTGESLPWAEVFDPRTRTWAATGDMLHPRSVPGLVLLADGRVLAVGGGVGWTETATAEIYDPATGRWSATASMAIGRYGPLAARLPDGRVLVAGGFTHEAGALATAEIYDPATGLWSAGARMSAARAAPSATVTLLANGRILVVGGLGGDGCRASAEYYDPVVGAWRSAGSMSVGRCFHAAVLTASGSVLVAGGLSSLQGPALASAELYDPATNTWARTAGMTEAREAPAAALLPSGDVLLAGGMNPGAGVSRGSELFHPVGRPPR
jgi:hypothetical protein